jgi:hypothetical protein
LQLDVGTGPAGDVWVTNNWQDHNVCYGKPSSTVRRSKVEPLIALSTSEVAAWFALEPR